MESLADSLPVEVIDLRLRQIKAATPKGFDALRPENLHKLRLMDIAHYIGVERQQLYQKRAAYYLQRELSWFFKLWDAGQLRKVEVNGQWQVVRGTPGVAKVAPQAGTPAPGPAHRLNIDMTAAGLRLRVGKVNGS